MLSDQVLSFLVFKKRPAAQVLEERAGAALLFPEATEMLAEGVDLKGYGTA